MKKETFIVEIDKDGLSAYHESRPIFTVAHSKDELFNNILEAANLFYENEKVLKREDIAIQIDFKTFFKEFDYLKANAIAKRAGINNSLITQYIKGIKNPSEKQLNKLLRSIREIGRELGSISFEA